MVLAASIVMLFKLVAFPVVAAVLTGRALISLSAWLPGRLRTRIGDQGPRPFTLLAIMLIGMGIAFIPYAMTWSRYGSPSYPVKIQIGSTVLSDGWMTMDGIQSNTKTPVLLRYARAWTDVWTNTSMESGDGMGILFVMVLLPATIVMTVLLIFGGSLGHAILAASFWLVLVVPGYHSLRYSLYILLPASVLSMVVISRIVDTRLRSAAVGTVLLITLLSPVATVQKVIKGYEYRLTQGYRFSKGRRDRDFVVRFARVTEFDPSYRTLRTLHQLVPPHMTVVSAVTGYSSLLYDDLYSYRVVHRPAKAWGPLWTPQSNSNEGLAFAAEWLRGLQRDGVAFVIAYEGWAEDIALSEPGSGYTRVYRQPASEGPVPIVIFSRTSDPNAR